MSGETEPFTPGTINQLASEVRRAVKTVEADREANLAAREAFEQRTVVATRKLRWYRRAGVIGVVVGTFGLVVGMYGAIEVNRIYDQRRQSRIIQCQQENRTAERINALGQSVNTILTLATQTSSSRTPDQQAIVDTFLERSRQAIADAKVPARDCSPEGIARFYRQ